MSFKIFADFESVLRRLLEDKISNAFFTKKYQAHVPCSCAYKVVCIDDRFSKPVVLYRGKTAVNKFIEAILNEYDYYKLMVIQREKCSSKFIEAILNEYNYYKLMIKKHFNKNDVMKVEDKRSNKQ